MTLLRDSLGCSIPVDFKAERGLEELEASIYLYRLVFAKSRLLELTPILASLDFC